MDNLTVEIVAFILVIAVILTVIGWVMELKIYQLVNCQIKLEKNYLLIRNILYEYF